MISCIMAVGFTVNDIAEQTGVSIGTIYHHINNEVAPREHFKIALRSFYRSVMAGVDKGRETPSDAFKTIHSTIDKLVKMHNEEVLKRQEAESFISDLMDFINSRR